MFSSYIANRVTFVSAALDMFYSESQYVSTKLHGIKLNHCTVGDNSWSLFL